MSGLEIFLHNLHVFVEFSYLMCMDLAASLIFFNLYGLYFFA
jgi:hypothetical protein